MAQKLISFEWKSDIVNWPSISKDTASLMLSQSESLLKETIDTAKTITAKSEKLLSFQIPILTSILVYLFNTNRNNSTLALTAIIALCIVLISLYFSYQTFKKYNIAVTGEFPNIIVTSKFIDKYPDPVQQYCNVFLNTCENIQNRIDKNMDLNAQRSNSNHNALKALITLALCPVLAHGLLWLFPGMHF